MDQLKPCPFCGGKVYIGLASGGNPGNYVEVWQIHGGHLEGDCSCRVFMESGIFYPEYGGAAEKEKLIERWNRREETNNILQRLEDLLNTTVDSLERSAYIRAMCIVEAGGEERLGKL